MQAPAAAGCGRQLARANPPDPSRLSSPRRRRFLLGTSDRSGDQGAAGATREAGSHLPAHGRLPAAWLPHAERDLRGLRGEARLETWVRARGRPPARTPLPRSPCRPRRPESRPALCSLAPRRSSCRTSSGKSTAWLVRSSTRTWTKIIRVRSPVSLVKKHSASGSGNLELGVWAELSPFCSRGDHSFIQQPCGQV